LVLLIILPAIALIWLGLSRGGVDPAGNPIGTDYLSFWTAARLALAGQPAAPYDVAVHYAAQRAAFQADLGYAAFFYPPPFLLVLLPFGVLPYFGSLAVWLASTGYFYWRMVRQWVGRMPGALLSFLAYPAILINAGHGQNGFLTAALLAGGAFWIQTRPILAGALLGSLIIKPHLALAIPFALAFRGAWKSFLAAGATAFALLALSFLVFGATTWEGFLANSALARATLETGLVDPAKMQSVFAATRLAGGSLGLAYGLQAVLVVAILALLFLAAKARARADAQGALLVLGTMLASPFLLDYDLTVAIVPIAFLFCRGNAVGYRPWEKAILALAFILPLAGRTIAMTAGVSIAPPILIALLIVLARRAFAEKEESAPSPAHRA
jgi:hypothetical protein